MANTLLTNDVISKLMLMEFKNNLVLARTARRQYQNIFDNTTGRTIRIRKPVRLSSADGAQLKIQDITQNYTNLTIDQRKHVGIALTSEQLTLQLNDFQETVVRPAMQRLANDVDIYLYSKSINFYNYVGTAGTAPSTYATVSSAGAKMDALGIPMENRYLLASSKDGDSIRQGMLGYFEPKFISPILKDRSMGRIAGFDMYTAQNVKKPTVQTVGGTPLVNGASQSGSSLIIDGVTAAQVITAGTVFQIAGVDSVNPVSLNDTQYVANFVVTETATADGSGNVTLAISPPITLTGPYQTVTALPANNAAITFQASHTINVAYHQEAFTLAMINLFTPKSESGVWARNMVDKDANISMRFVRQYNIDNDCDVMRADILFGGECFGEYGTRVMGS
jgi:hypothetical protein